MRPAASVAVMPVPATYHGTSEVNFSGYDCRRPMQAPRHKQLVIFGASNILSDLFDCALALGMVVTKVVTHLPESGGERDIDLATRVQAWGRFGPVPALLPLDAFQPGADEAYLLGPTTPTRQVLADEVQRRFGLGFCTLVHPAAYVSPLAAVGAGTFVGACSAIGPGAQLGEHVFVNRGVTVGHDTRIGAFSRVQPGSNIGGLTRIGSGVTIGIGATVVERLVIGDGAFIGAGAVVASDVAGGARILPARARALHAA